MADAPIDCDFPVWGLMPKKETGVVSFITKNPIYDGRDTVIAIFDSGVDPAAAGLTVTSTGETKVIERYDCSGCGDVDTSTVIKKVTDGCITGLTGRKLKIPETWKNPSGSWRVGILHPFSIYPTKLKERVQEHRKEHSWDIGYKPAFAEANKNLQDFENDVVSKNPILSPEDKIQKEELEARVEVLQNAEKKYNDVGPTYDCVLFHDGNVWRACIDTSECGDLASGPFLGEYSVTHEHTHLTPFDEMTISINVHDEGQTLEVVGMCSTHGTHVAAIASGYFPDEPERNGVAPGAKIVSLTIGDSRLGSMETGTALVRACIKVMELSKKMKIDVINMSYGEHAHWSNSGRVGDIICEVVNRYNVSWVVSAGNHGPALCTVGAPPDIAQPILIGVGAYVSPEMMSAAYSMRARLPGGAFSWSSRGPTADGAAGVSVCAPGGAVAAVARFTLRNSQLMNGTSMAAPHVAGAVAMLVSGLKAKNLAYSPYSIKRSLENSANYLSHVEPWAQGCGLLNVEKAFDLLSEYSSAPERDVTFSIQCGPSNAKGILLRPRIDDVPKDIGITVEPQFLQDHNDMENISVIPKQIAFGMRLALTCDAAWVSCPQYLDMMNAARPWTVRVDTTGLKPGPHFTSILAYDVSAVSKGPVFRVPVTVLQPEPIQLGGAAPASLVAQDVLFQPATIVRHFLIVPPEATWGVLKISTEDKEKTGRFLIHTMQLLPKRSCRCHETQKMINVTSEAPASLHFQVVGGVTLEVVIAKYWANLGEVSASYSVELHGLAADFGQRLVLGAADGLRAVTLRALRHQDLQPAAQLKPSESKIIPLTARDVIPPSRQIYQLVNTYNFHIAKATEVSPIISLLCDMLYESEFESQMWMLYNSCKQLMATGDAYPSKYSVKLEKGEYTLRLNVRHENRALLDKLADLPAVIQQRLPAPIALDVYCSQAQVSPLPLSTHYQVTAGQAGRPAGRHPAAPARAHRARRLLLASAGQSTPLSTHYQVTAGQAGRPAGRHPAAPARAHRARRLLLASAGQSTPALYALPGYCWTSWPTCRPSSSSACPRPSRSTSTARKRRSVHSRSLRTTRLLLDKLADLPAVIQQRLPAPIALDVYCSQAQVSPLPLSTHYQVTAGQAGRPAGRHPAAPARAHRARRLLLASAEGDKLDQVYEELVEKFPGYLGAHIAYLNALDSPTDPKKLPHANEEPDVTTAWCEQLISISDKVIKAIDQDKLLAYLGMKNDTRSDAHKIKQ
ncbi:hypothetical protein HF086_000859 [Spodoptera exigua]|uniref:Tripeptidyl-peptidase 2 n=1 Tax=Spodoptera exigua TaxID=7107 RepID=A0A922MEG4_SPOEX|nr:hypothetical protein HF086_000859 [Spodoptera exigua]